MSLSTTSNRLRYLDWMRGVAALIMLQGHTFHSFVRADLRDSGPYVLSQFVGGLPPAVFLFLTGVTMAFRMDSDGRSGLKPIARITSALSRARYLFVLALLFRLQLWIFSAPHGPLATVAKVDVLNCMALAGAALAVLAVFSTADRARMGVTAGVAIAALSPLVTQLDWSRAPWLLRDYIAPDYQFFGFFPWAAFFAFGLSAGSIIRLLRDDQIDRAMQWGALLGAGLIAGGRYFSELPYSLYPKSEFWLDSPALTLIKLGILLWILAFAFIWTRYAVGPSWSFVAQLGTTSLLVYWVHIELVYGRWFGSWKESLDNTQATAFSVVLIAAMLGLSVLRTSMRKWRVPTVLRWYPSASPGAN